MSKPTVYLTVGVPASGKSTYCKEMNAIVLSSDTTRKELFKDLSYADIQKDNLNSVVFESLFNIAEKLLKQGNDVVIDATNISRKKRTAFVDRFGKIAKTVALYFDTDYNTCIERNKERNSEAYVPLQAMDNMRKNLQVPTYSEGWDFIEVIRKERRKRFYNPTFTEDQILLVDTTYAELFGQFSIYEGINGMYEFPQDNKYHSFSVSRHTYHVYKHIKESCRHMSREDYVKMLWTAILHDTGKPFTKSFYNHKGEETRYANFIGHENVSGQIALNTLLAIGYDLEFALDVVELVNYHMRIRKADTDKAKKKLIKQVGEDVYNKLLLFAEADDLAK